MTIPGWVPDAIFYQIFPDRFANGDTSIDPLGVVPWGSPPSIIGFQGGDLEGIRQKLDYLTDLGVTALYLNPIFTSPSTHRYNTTDYYQIDPKLGTLAEFKRLLGDVHSRGFHIILDGVFNHCGRGFFAFSDLLENQSHSPYREWFHVHKFPIDAYSPGDAVDYVGWWKYKSLPKFNTNTPAVRKYLYDVARYWIDLGIDGWRLDVPNEIDDDSFWGEFREVVRAANPEAYLLGEIWDGNPRWVGEQHFDGLMDYPFREATLGFATGVWHPSRYSQKMIHNLRMYPIDNVKAMYVLLGSHDVERPLTMCSGKVEEMRIAILLQMTQPGTPSIYYGDEIGLTGGKDPGCRGAFIWDETKWNWELRSWYQRLIQIRKTRLALRSVDYRVIQADDQSGSLIYLRGTAPNVVLVAVNQSKNYLELGLDVTETGWDEGKAVTELLSFQEVAIRDGRLNLKLAPLSGGIYE